MKLTKEICLKIYDDFFEGWGTIPKFLEVVGNSIKENALKQSPDFSDYSMAMEHYGDLLVKTAKVLRRIEKEYK